MLSELTPLNKEKYHINCPHCGNIIIEDDIVKTDGAEDGCDVCITRCKECGKLCFEDELNKYKICVKCIEYKLLNKIL